MAHKYNPMRKLATPVLSFLLAGMFFFGCQMDKFDLSNLNDEMALGQDWSAPLIRGELTMDNLLETFDSTSLINEDSAGLLYLVYTDSLFSQSAEDEVTVPNQDFFDLLYKVPSTINNFSSTVNVSIDTMHRVQFENGAELDSIITDNFLLRQSLASDIKHDIQIIITYIDVVKDEQPLKDTIDIPYTGSTYSDVLEKSLSGYTIKTFQPDTSDHYYFRMNYQIQIEGTGNDLTQGNEVSIQNQLETINMQSAYGYVGKDTLLSEEGELPVNIFEDSQDGTIEFAAPEFKFIIQNSFGLPVLVELNNTTAYTEGTNDSTNIVFTDSANIFEIDFPELSEMGETKETVVSINNDNCNLSEALGTNPSHISFKAKGVSNPDGSSGPYNFVTENSEFRVNTELYLPLWLKASGFSLTDTVDLDMSDVLGDSTDIFKEVITKFKVNNGLPADVDFQVYFLDENFQPVDTLFETEDRPVIASATTDANGEVISTTEKVSEMSFNEYEISDLEQVRNAIFEASLSTSDFDQDKKVKFYSHYNVEFRMAVEMKTEIDLNN